MVLVWLVARSRARVVVLVLAGGLLVYEYIKACFVWCGVGVVVYICIYVSMYIMRLPLVWWWSARVYMDRYIYNGGLLVFCACVYL